MAAILRLANDRGANGAVVLFNLAWTVFLLPWAVLAVPVATAAFPTWCRTGSPGENRQYARRRRPAPGRPGRLRRGGRRTRRLRRTGVAGASCSGRPAGCAVRARPGTRHVRARPARVRAGRAALARALRPRRRPDPGAGDRRRLAGRRRCGCGPRGRAAAGLDGGRARHRHQPGNDTDRRLDAGTLRRDQPTLCKGSARSARGGHCRRRGRPQPSRGSSRPRPQRRDRGERRSLGPGRGLLPRRLRRWWPTASTR